MAFTARDGSKHSMASRMRAHNVHSDAKAGRQNKASSAILDSPAEGEQDEGMDEQDPHAVVAEHGPAMQTQTTHPAEGEEGEHTVESEHPDGHKHHSKHATGEEAHETAACLSGHCAHGEDAQDGMEGESDQEY
jgi:hypothetical protein